VVQIARQRVIIKYALDTGQHSEMAESLLDALEGSLRLFEKHRSTGYFCSVAAPPTTANKEKAPAAKAGARLGFARHGGHRDDWTVTDARSLPNSAFLKFDPSLKPAAGLSFLEPIAVRAVMEAL
jgi:hypothetical protein